MKHSFFALFFFCTSCLMAQSLEFSGQFYTESYGQRIIPMANGNWFFAGKIFPGLWEDEEFTVIYGGISNNANLFPLTPVPEHDNSNALSLYQKLNGNILLAVEDFACGENEASKIYEINNLGEIIQEYLMPSACTQFMEIKRYQDNYYVSCQQSIYQFFNNGTIWENLTDLGEIRSFIPIYSGLNLVGCHEGNDFYGIKKVNGQNQVITTLDLTEEGEVLQLKGLTFNKNAVLQKNHLNIFDDNLIIQNSISIQVGGLEFQRMTFDENSIWVLAKDSENNNYLYGFDYELNLINDFFINNNGLIANDLAIQNNQIALVGTGNSGMFQDTISGVTESFETGKNFWIKTFDKDGEPIFSNTDISLDNIIIDSAQVYEIPVSCDSGNLEINGWEGDFQNIAITITNHGESTLEYFEANLQVFGCPTDACEIEEETLLNQQYPNLNLAPNESITVPFPNFKSTFSDTDLPQLCFWLSVPNQQIDQDVSNNVFCKYFFDTTIDNTSSTFDKNDLNIYPIPVKDILNINFEKHLKFDFKILIHNDLGQIIYKNDYQRNTTAIKINALNFPMGTYFLQIEDLNKTVISSKKVIKM